MKKLCIRLILVFSLFVANSLFAQETTLKGKVLDAETNQPLMGASIVVKNTMTGTATDFDGQFSINVNEGAILVFTSLGYVTKEMAVSGLNNELTISLDPDLSQLDEVVIVGYGTQKKVNLTGSISTIKSEEIVQNSTANVSSALAGRLAGVVTVQSSGEPGGDASTIRIRGLSSINGNSPLVLVDGIPRSLNNVNANDIESISVLKDAAASAIYGMRAANGVVLITTKRGKGKTSLNVNMYSGVQTPTRLPNFLDSYNYGLLLNEANANDGVARAYTDAELQKFYEGTDPDAYPNTDWMDEALKSNAMMHSVDISASGSDKEDQVKYFTSLGYLYQDALFENNDFDRFNFRSNLDIKINDAIKLTTDFSGSLETRNRPGISASSIFSNLMRTPPVRVNQFSNGGYSEFSQQPAINSGGSNATQDFEFQSKIALRIDFPFLEGLNLTTQVAYDRNTYRNKSFGVPSTYTTFNVADRTFDLSTPSSRGQKASLSESQNQGYKVVTEGILGYNKTLDKHDFGAKLIYSRTYTQGNFLYGGISNILGTSVPFFKAGDAETRSLSNSTGESAILGYAGRITYAFDSKYLFEFNGRYDGSYRFSNDAKFDFFPSYSAAWRVSQEDFLKESNTISNLKFRFSYGELGSDDVSPFRYLEFFEFGGPFIDDSTVVPSIQSSGLADASTTWEKAKTYNFGLELGLWNNALTIEADVYSKRTTDILTTRTLEVPGSFGASLPLENIGVVDNKGYEIVISHNGGVKDFNYFADFNFSQAKNEIIDIAESPDVDPLRKRTGRPIGTRFGYIADGLFLTQQEIDDLDAAAPEGVYQTQSPQPGDIRYRDITGDGKVDDKDRTVIGKGSVPEITFGLNLGFTYKQFDFSALFQGATNFDMYLSNEAAWAFFNGGKVFDKHLDRAQIGADGNVINTNASYPRITLNNNAVNERTSSYWLVAGDYIRFKNVEIGYTLPQKVMDKMGVNRLRVYFNGRNLVTWSDIKHLDPENPNQRGWFYPQQKVFNLGINLEF